MRRCLTVVFPFWMEHASDFGDRFVLRVEGLGFRVEGA